MNVGELIVFNIVNAIRPNNGALVLKLFKAWTTNQHGIKKIKKPKVERSIYDKMYANGTSY